MKRAIATTILLAATMASTMIVAGCNTVRGAGEDAKSVGRVFSDDPNGKKQP